MLNKFKFVSMTASLLTPFWVYANYDAAQAERVQRAEAHEIQSQNLLSTQEAYELGKISMQTKNWSDAVAAFEQAASNSQLKQASMYWQAYSHYQIKQNAQARRLLKRLLKNHPKSEWADDAQVLLFEHGDGDEQSTHQSALDEELKLFTLQQIMFNKPDKALPKVYDLLENSDSERVKHNAIQMLGLSDSDQVTDYLFRFIQQTNNHNLQHQAIQMLSMRDTDVSRKKLQQLYTTSTDQQIKSAIIQGFIHHDDSTELVGLLEQESNPELSIQLIQMLGIKGESAALKDQYKQSAGQKKRAILEALAMSGDAQFIYYVIDNETDPAIRKQAIHSLVMVDDDDMGSYLARLYDEAESEAEKDVISHVFIATDIDAALVTRLYETETSAKRKQQLIHTLMAMGEEQALRELYQLENNAELMSVASIMPN